VPHITGGCDRCRPKSGGLRGVPLSAPPVTEVTEPGDTALDNEAR